MCLRKMATCVLYVCAYMFRPDLQTADGGRYKLLFELRLVNKQQAKISPLLDSLGCLMLTVVQLQSFSKKVQTCRKKAT